MAQTQKRAARAGAAPLHIPMKLAGLDTEDSASLDFRQAPIGAVRLARRFGMPIATAAVVAQLAGIGGAHA